MNNTINFSNINNFSTIVNSHGSMSNVILENCKVWEGRTYGSHLIYMKLLLLMFVIQQITIFWNPKITIKIPIDLGDNVKIFKKKIKTIWLIHWDNLPILEYINKIIFFILISYIGNIFLVQYMVFEGRNYLGVLKLLLGGK